MIVKFSTVQARILANHLTEDDDHILIFARLIAALRDASKTAETTQGHMGKIDLVVTPNEPE